VYHDKKVADAATDYIFLVHELIRLLEELSLSTGLSDVNTQVIIDKILNKEARSISDTGKSMKYRDLIENQFGISKLTTIERNDNQIISEFDFSSNTIKQLIERGYQRGLQAQIGERVRFIDVTIECGIITDKTKKNPFAPESKKVQSAFETAVDYDTKGIEEKLRQLGEINTFANWCKRAEKQPYEIISKLSVEIIRYLKEYVKVYYANFFISNINTLAGQNYEDRPKLRTSQSLLKSNVVFDFEPVEIFVKISKLVNRIKTSEMKLIFKVNTSAVAQKMMISYFGHKGIKTYLGEIKSNLKLSVSEIFDTHLDVPILLMDEEFHLENLYTFNAQRIVNVWINNHKATEPLIKAAPYDLMINVDMKGSDSISLLDADFLERIGAKPNGIEISVSISGDDFDIPNDTKEMFLPKEGHSDPISFKIIPNASGTSKLKLYFYYKLNLIMILSVSMEIKEPISDITTILEKEQHFLNVDVIGSSNVGFESILQIERSKA
jgi:hypothetical protein